MTAGGSSGSSGRNFPEVAITEVTDSGFRKIDVSYAANANGDGDLSTVTVTVDPFLGPTRSEPVSVSGETDTGTFTVRTFGSQTVTVTVTDTDGNTASDTVLVL